MAAVATVSQVAMMAPFSSNVKLEFFKTLVAEPVLMFDTEIWCRFLVKQLIKDVYSNYRNYIWYEMVFFAHCIAPGQTSILCLDTPETFRTGLLAALSSSRWNTNRLHPYLLHTFLIDEVLHLYDESVWTIRDVVRNVEKSRDQSRHVEPDFPSLHDVARHAIHSSETLQVAINTMSRMIIQCDQSFESAKPLGIDQQEIMHHIQQCCNSQLQGFQNLKARSDSNQARLNNEITLSFNTIAQRNSHATVLIGKAARSDSAAMKTVAVVTMAFLPATFVAAIFSTTFFDFTPDGRSGKSWIVSDKLWIYWSFAGPLTVVTIAFWYLWQRRWGMI